MAIANLKIVDGDLVLPLPMDAANKLSLQDGSPVDVSAEEGRIIVTTKERHIPQYNLDDLLADYEQWPQEMKDYREWIDAPRVGRELI